MFRKYHLFSKAKNKKIRVWHSYNDYPDMSPWWHWMGQIWTQCEWQLSKSALLPEKILKERGKRKLKTTGIRNIFFPNIPWREICAYIPVLEVKFKSVFDFILFRISGILLLLFLKICIRYFVAFQNPSHFLDVANLLSHTKLFLKD